MDNETMVEEQNTEFEADDALQEELVEETDESEESLEDLLDESEKQPAEKKQKEPQGTGGEPGWFKKRWDKEVGKLTEQIRNQIRGEYEAQLAPLREQMLETEAEKLVRSGKVKDLETAKELVRYRQGQPQEPKQTEQPRNAQGQFQEKEDPVTQAKIGMLQHQADRIKESGGPDVIGAFQKDQDVREKVISGEWDFYDVAEHLKASPKRRAPAPMRSPNGASGMNPNAIDTMSDEQFERMEKNIKKGARYTLR